MGGGYGEDCAEISKSLRHELQIALARLIAECKVHRGDHDEEGKRGGDVGIF